MKTVEIYTDGACSGNPAAKIWRAVMKDVHANLSATGFSKPAGVVTAEVCLDSGLLATEACKNDPRGSRVISEFFNKKYLPTEECTTHVFTPVCADSGLLANPTCLSLNTTTEKVFIDRKYEEPPRVLPNDYAYEVPFDYCEVHYCEKDEFGNYITSKEEESYPDGDENYFESEEFYEEKTGEDEPFWWEEE